MHSLVSLYGNNSKETPREQLTTGDKGSGKSSLFLQHANLIFWLVFLTVNGCLHAQIVPPNKEIKTTEVSKEIYMLYSISSSIQE